MGKIIRNEKIITPTQYIEKLDESSLQSLIDGRATEIVVPDGTEIIRPYAFYKSVNLKKITIPNSVHLIGQNLGTSGLDDGYVFSKCSNLEEVDLSDITYSKNQSYQGLQYLCYQCTKLNTFKFPINNTITIISPRIFYDCNNLVNIELPNNITQIRDYAFSGCYLIPFTDLPVGLKMIGSSAFLACKSLAITEIPSGVTSLESGAFQNCTSLTKLTLKGNITKINYNVFSGCTNLTKFTFPNNTAVPTLSNVNAIPNGANYTGQIAIPNSLYDTWTTATNWVSLIQAQWIRFIDSWDETITVEGDYALKTDTDLADVRHLTPAS